MDALITTGSPRKPAQAAMYAQEASRQTFDRLESLAMAVIAAGFPVMVDAAFLMAEQRHRFRQLARSGVPFRILSSTAPADELAARVETRQIQKRDEPDADAAVLQLQVSSDGRISGPRTDHHKHSRRHVDIRRTRRSHPLVS